MSSITNKMRDAVSGDKQQNPTGTVGGTGSSNAAGSTNYEPHGSNVANKLDPSVDSDLDGSHNRHGTATGSAITSGSTTAGTTPSYGHNTGSATTTGPHNSNVAKKLDPTVDSDLDDSYNRHGTTTGTTGDYGHNTITETTGGYGHNTGSATTAGSHNSNVANKLDSTVDSDLDGSHNRHGTAVGTTGDYGHNTTTGTTGGYGHNTGSATTAGSHNSNVANKLDPTVDSDLSSSRNTGTHGTGIGSNTAHSAIGGLSTSHGTGPTNYGPHDSNTANKLDPTVDSDRNGSHARHGTKAGTGANVLNTGSTTTTQEKKIGGSGVTGTTKSGAQSKTVGSVLDPVHSSEHDHGSASGKTPTVTSHTQRTTATEGKEACKTGTHGTSSHGVGAQVRSTGPAPATAGPHKSDLLNKLDPRVDSDLDGSKTFGGDKTYAGPTTSSKKD